MVVRLGGLLSLVGVGGRRLRRRRWRRRLPLRCRLGGDGEGRGCVCWLVGRGVVKVGEGKKHVGKKRAASWLGMSWFFAFFVLVLFFPTLDSGAVLSTMGRRQAFSGRVFYLPWECNNTSSAEVVIDQKQREITFMHFYHHHVRGKGQGVSPTAWQHFPLRNLITTIATKSELNKKQNHVVLCHVKL